MARTEFDLIERYFARPGPRRRDVSLAIGDDSALLRMPAGMELAVCIDTMTENVHFSAGTEAEALGHKALAVNLSDLAAMGAEPAWATLALTLPRMDSAWLESFSRGFFQLAERYQVQLVGGDTCAGPLSITVQAHGFVTPDRVLRRDAARAGDLIYVTGTLGDAGLALLALQEELRLPVADKNAVLEHLQRPEPRIDQGLALAGLAHAAIDISDGLAADLGHILSASGVGATVYVERLPCSDVVQRHFHAAGGWSLPLSAGDDYELCFTAASDRQAQVEAALAQFDVRCTWIGIINPRPGLQCVLDDGTDVTPAYGGYAHFS